MRNSNKSKLLLLPNFLLNSNTIVLKKHSLTCSLSILGRYFLVYSGVKFLSIRTRYPFIKDFIKSFIKSRPDGSLISSKFRLKAKKKKGNSTKKK